MINRNDFERYLLNHRNCEYYHGRDTTLCRTVNGTMYIATFGGHQRKQVKRSSAHRFLRDLGFAEGECNDILQIFL